jgi:hypothetical protein
MTPYCVAVVIAAVVLFSKCGKVVPKYLCRYSQVQYLGRVRFSGNWRARFLWSVMSLNVRRVALQLGAHAVLSDPTRLHIQGQG